MGELPQITILRTNSKVVGAHTFRKFFLIFNRKTYVSYELQEVLEGFLNSHVFEDVV
ncbi:hypothetical protein LBBP_01313 [Leptospira borgpetersenii serovar Ballum]|uniref:Uncharacterized protein n=1 Tax=Leptospira borgpetersenii serovar Ballum TaxID=280505 RepID=A0A0S2IPK8_LEPBO|nr:hypothetical protein LBBP_01313 [Leptospira borgpetersenii serovar Ballum]